MDALLNEATRTVHRRATERAETRAVCGATIHLDSDHLLETTITEATDDVGVEKCGRCFDEGGGY